MVQNRIEFHLKGIFSLQANHLNYKPVYLLYFKDFMLLIKVHRIILYSCSQGQYCIFDKPAKYKFSSTKPSKKC